MSSSAPGRGGRIRWVAVLLACVLVIAGAAYLIWFRPKPTPQPPAADHDGAVAANLRGIAFLERLQYEPAQKELEEAVRLDPDWIPARVNLGISLLNQQPSDTKTLALPTERAKQVLNEVLARDPDNKHAHYCIGVIEQYVGHLPEAYEHYVVVNRFDPNDPHTWLRLGACHPNGAQSHEAGECYEKALKIDPYLNEARYRLFQALSATDPDRAKAALAEFDKLRSADWETGSSLEKYGEQGKYAHAIGWEPAGNPVVGPLPLFEVPANFQVTLAPGARWATAADLDPLRKAARERFGGTMILFDFNGDGRPDIFLLSAVVQDGRVRDLLLRNDGDFKWTDVTASAGLAAPRVSLGAAAADYDNDGYTDLVVTGAGGQHLFRNKGDSTFEDVSAAAGLDKVTGVCLGCGWADLDQDGDLDLVICRYAETADAAVGFAGNAAKGGLVLLENVGEARPARPNSPFQALTTRFKPNEALATPAGPCAAVAVVIADLDGDHDLDVLVLADGAGPILLDNDRLLRFHRATPPWTTGLGDRFNGGLVFVATHAARPDLLLTRPNKPPVLLTATGMKDHAVASVNAGTWRQAVTVDVDLDGWADAVGLSATGPGLLHNQGEAHFEHKTGAFGLAESLPANAFAVACADLNGDCNPDLLVWSDAGLAVRRNTGNGNRALGIDPTGRKEGGAFMRTNASGIGCRVVAKCPSHWAAAERNTAAAGLGQSLVSLSLGMGKHEVADAVEVLWPDGVVQVEIAMAARCGGDRLAEFSRKTTSCPVLLTWNGERFVFVTDFLGAGSMGELAADGSTRPPRPEESVKIESRMLKLKDGQYVLKIAEPMDEVCYLDHLRLDVVDHPAGAAVFPDERFATSDPQPTQELLSFRDRRFPKKATDGRGTDVTQLVRERDRKAPDEFEVRSWLGFAGDHSLTLDFGDMPAGKNWHLVLAGWTEYPYPESIYAAERAGVPLQFPVLERLAVDGKTWGPLGDLGFPAGLPRVMTRPLPDLKSGPCTLRIRTNMQIYWDQVYLAPAIDSGLKVHSLDVAKADLANRGFMQLIFPKGRPPLEYDDSKTESVAVTEWKGNLTRAGDVTELLTAADDRFVTFGPGDEITIRFDASKLPPVPAGWERSFVLRSRGYSKDTAPFTALGGNVEPLPFRAMKNYPDFGGAKPPATDAAKWNTRPVGGR